MNRLNAILDQLEAKISIYEVVNTTVSSKAISWHIEHTLLTVNGIIDALHKSNPKDYKWKFNLVRLLVLTRKQIPRGKAKAPEIVLPKETIEERQLLVHLAKARLKIAELANLEANHFFYHPLCGNLKLDQTISFLEIHSNHHLAIIKDIANAQIST